MQSIPVIKAIKEPPRPCSAQTPDRPERKIESSCGVKIEVGTQSNTSARCSRLGTGLRQWRSIAMRSDPRPVCDHPALNGRNGICPDCRRSVWFHEPRPFTPTELAVQRAVEVMSRWASAGTVTALTSA